jgi:hypothetical protein
MPMLASVLVLVLVLVLVVVDMCVSFGRRDCGVSRPVG